MLINIENSVRHKNSIEQQVLSCYNICKSKYASNSIISLQNNIKRGYNL